MDHRVASCLLVSKVLVADGIVTDAEREFLSRYMERLGLTPEERAQVVELEGWEEADVVAQGMTQAEKQAVLDEASEAALVDGTLSPLELNAVKQLASLLGLG